MSSRGSLTLPQAASAVVIAADKEVRYEMVVKVMDALQKEGVKRVGLAVKLAN